MPDFERDRSQSRTHSRTSSQSASRHSSRHSSALSAEEQELADNLQSAEHQLKDHGRSTSSSSGSEARDRLKEAEAVERNLEFLQKHGHSSGSGAKKSSQNSDSEPSRARKSPHSSKRSGPSDRPIGPGLTSEKVLGLASGRWTQSSGPSSMSDDHSTSGSSDVNWSTGASSAGMGDLHDKINKLEQALHERDEQTTELIQNCANMDKTNQENLVQVQQELQVALKAKETAENDRNTMELRAAGERAQHKSNMAFEMEESQKLQDAQRGHDQAMSDTRVELKAARDDLDNRVKSWELDVAHSYAMKTISDDRILSLEKALKESNSRLSAAYKKPTKPSSSSSSGLDAELRRSTRPMHQEKELGLREEIHALEQEKQHNNKEMSSIRLELLGLKRENERKKAETTSSLRGRGRGRKGRGRSSRKFLEIIDEEDDNDDLPDSKSVDQEDWASECVSSDCGDNDVDDCGTSLPDTTAQLDAVNKLLLELSNERNLKQSLRAEQAGQSAEHNEQIEQLRQQMTESSLLQEKTAAENQRLKSLDSENRVQNLRQVDGLQVKVRDLEELLCDQRAMVQEQWRFAREHEFNKSALEEKLQMQTEALRITSMRLQDALQQHQNEAVRHQQELNSLKLQLALEKKKGGGTAAEVEPSEAKDPQPETSMEFLEQRVKDLQEERNILVGKLEVKEVQYHLQLDDLFRENASKLRDQRIQFEEQIAAIQAKFELRNHLQGQAFDYINTASSSHPVLGQATPPATSEDPKGSPRPEDLDARKVLTSGQSGSSTPHTRSVVSAGTDSSAVSESLSGVKSMVWTIIGLLPNVAAMLCTVEALIIQQVTPRVSVLLGGSDLIGKSFFSLVRQSSAASFRRTMQVNQAMAEGSQCDIPNFLARTLARYELVAPDGKSVDVVISTAHLPGEHKVGERHILLLLVEQPSERLRGQYSVASSDVCPSDSVSVGRRRPQLMSSEAQRTKLRASFFSSSRQSARVSTSSESPSPRSSLCK